MSAWSVGFRSLARLALPIVVAQVGLLLMGIVDTIMAGHVTREAVEGQALGQVTLGHAYSWFWIIFGMGAITAVDPIVAQAFGAEDPVAIRRAIQRSLLLTVAYALSISVPLLLAHPALALLGQAPEIIEGAAPYSQLMAISLLPFYVFVVLRQALQSMDSLAATLWTILLANVANVFLNWVLIFGNLGAPALGAVGCAWATVGARWLMVFLLLALSWGRLGPHIMAFDPRTLRRAPIVRMLRLGVPIGFHYQLEIGVFAATAIMMGHLGIPQVAGHMVALHLAAFMFMVPQGISAAVAVRVGQAVGRLDHDAVRAATMQAFVLGVAFMGSVAIVLVAFPEALARIWTAKPAVLAVAVALIPIAAAFQIFDGVQVVAVGVLRGLGDTRTAALIALLGFWLVGFPVGWALAFPLRGGATGLWWGLVAGLGTVAVLLTLRVRQRLSGHLTRIIIEDT